MELAVPSGQACPLGPVEVVGILGCDLQAVGQPQHPPTDLSLLAQCLSPVHIAARQQTGYFLLRRLRVFCV